MRDRGLKIAIATQKKTGQCKNTKHIQYCLTFEEQYNTTSTRHYESYIDAEWGLQPVHNKQGSRKTHQAACSSISHSAWRHTHGRKIESRKLRYLISCGTFLPVSRTLQAVNHSLRVPLRFCTLMGPSGFNCTWISSQQRHVKPSRVQDTVTSPTHEAYTDCSSSGKMWLFLHACGEIFISRPFIKVAEVDMRFARFEGGIGNVAHHSLHA